MHELSSLLEVAYFISGITIAIVAIYGTKQIHLLKKNIEINSKRSAVEKAIEYCDRFLTSNRALYNKFILKCDDEGIPYSYKGPIGNFSPREIPPNFTEIHRKRQKLWNEWLPLVNDLDVISSAFVSGLADEKLGFNIIGRAFCSDVMSLYDLISAMRFHKTKEYYQSTVKLFRIWSPRLTKEELTLQKITIEKEMNKISDSEIKPIGVYLKSN